MSLQKLIGRLMKDRRGATAVTFGILAIPLTVIALGAIDMVRIGLTKQKMQEALDTAALMTARSPAQTNKDIDDTGDTIFLEHMDKSASGLESTFKPAPDHSIDAHAIGYMKPIILGLFGPGDVKMQVTTLVKRAKGTPVELALVLDTTGSMSGQPLTDLKKAATDMVKEMHKFSDGKNLKIGVVPFGQYVNIGVSRRNESWASVPADYSTTNPGTCTQQKSSTTCKSEAYSCTKYNDGKPYSSTCYKSVNCVTTTYNPPKLVCSNPSTSNYKFYGCIGSPAYPKNVEDVDVNRTYPGFLNVTCNSEFTPLTTDEKAVTDAIKVLTAKDYTYIPSGLAWGFNMLSSPKPLTDAAIYDPSGQNQQPRKALVLMTDGSNTVEMNKANGRHDQLKDPAKQADDYTAELCKNIKKQKIELFTVAFNLDDNKVKKMLQDCATDADHFFDASDAEKLQSAFGRIAEALRNLYIAK